MTNLDSILKSRDITFLSRSKHLLISWLQLPSAVILEPPNLKSLTVSIVSSSICHEVMGPDEEIVKTVADFLFWAPTSLQMVTVAMKLKDSCSLEGKL